MSARKRGRPKTLGVQTTLRSLHEVGIRLADERHVLLTFAVNALKVLGYDAALRLTLEAATAEMKHAPPSGLDAHATGKSRAPRGHAERDS